MRNALIQDLADCTDFRQTELAQVKGGIGPFVAGVIIGIVFVAGVAVGMYLKS